MADLHDIAAQWIETDAAFGVTEVPIPHPRHMTPAATQAHAVPAVHAQTGYAQPSAPAQSTIPPRPAMPVRSTYGAPQYGTRPAAPARPATGHPSQPVRHPTYAGSTPESHDMAKRKATVEMPPIPEGNIADLPPITREQKLSAMAALMQEANEFLGPYINGISTKIVFGEGDVDTPILFVGEGPGIEEDRQGRPFVGRSGQLLDKMIVAMGLAREKVFIANIVKLRAAAFNETTGRLQDRPPTPEEAALNIPILHKQIEIIRPKAIVTLGAPAIRYLIGEKEGIMKIRGNWRQYRGIPVMPTYHPAFVLRAYTPENRGKVWSDLQQALKTAGLTLPTKKTE